MSWDEIVVRSLKANDLGLVAYVPDTVLWKVLGRLQDDPFFMMVPVAREEEAFAIVAGAYAAMKRGAVFTQSSGFPNSINAIGSICIPFRIPLPVFVSMRGGLGEFNITQVATGQVVQPCLEAMGLQSFTITRDDEVQPIVDGAVKLSYAARQPVGILLSPLLTGGGGLGTS